MTMAPTALDELLAEYEHVAARRARPAPPNSLAAYRRDLAPLRRLPAPPRRRPTPARSSEATVAGYVDELRDARATTTAGRATRRRRSPARVAAVRSFHRFCVEEGVVGADPSEDVGAPARAAGDPEGAHRGRGRRAARRGRRRRPARAARPGDPRDALRRRACASASSSASTARDLDLDDGLVRVLGQGQQGAGRARSGARARDALDDYLDTRPARARPTARASGPAPATRCSSTPAAGASPARAAG